MTTPGTPSSVNQTPAQLAKGALRRLAEARLEPTPENYQNAYWAEAGKAATADHPARPVYELLLQRSGTESTDRLYAEVLQQLITGQWSQAEQRLKLNRPNDGTVWAELIDRTVRSVSRSNRQWTSARRKESLERVLTGSRSDASKLRTRLQQLITSWDAEPSVDTSPAPLAEADAPENAAKPAAAQASIQPLSLDFNESAQDESGGGGQDVCTAVSIDTALWAMIVAQLSDTVELALPTDESSAVNVSKTLSHLKQRVKDELDTELAQSFEVTCQQAQRLIAHRHYFTEQLGALTKELTSSLAELAEDDSWAQGQCQLMTQHLDEGLTARGVRSVSQLLDSTRRHQQTIRQEREEARNALKEALQRMLNEIGDLGQHTGQFERSISRYADIVTHADTLESLTTLVHEMVDETRSVHTIISQTQEKLQQEHSRASELASRVEDLENELRRVSQEVATDPLTQVSNRRGLLQAFEREQACAKREASVLSIALLDIDNFKRLNDELGHNTGDAALCFLSDRIKASLRPSDTLGRWGGEEFVILLPGTSLQEAAQTLSRLQRMLSAELFMYEGKQTFVTFSAGVAQWDNTESLENALERADIALYEAKHTGKNRTCTA